MATSSKSQSSQGTYRSPLEKLYERLTRPIDTFIQLQTAGGITLIAALIIAMTLANSAAHLWYEHLIHYPLGIKMGSMYIEHTVHHWVNDGLMAIFFLLVGLEIKREILVGELSSLSKASLPVVAAIGGMIVPALIYVAFNAGESSIRGWAIPTATDIAFAVGVLRLLGTRIPTSLMTFLLALAIADDLGAVLVIGIFYTEKVVLANLVIAGLLLGVLLLFNAFGVKRVGVYMLIGLGVWAAFLGSGVHATIAGVLIALTIPTRPKYNTEKFSEKIQYLMKEFDRYPTNQKSILASTTQTEIVDEIERSTNLVASPLHRLEHALHPYVTFLIIPIFALVNAGVPVDFSKINQIFLEPITLGIIFGLVIGKFVGIFGATWLAIKVKLCELPAETEFRQIAGTAILAGIGFTMSIFIGELAFKGQEELIVNAKMGILIASFVAGVGGYFWLYLSEKSLKPISAEKA